MVTERYTPFAKEYTKLTKTPYVKGVYYFEKQRNYYTISSHFHGILWESYYTLSRTNDRNKPYY